MNNGDNIMGEQKKINRHPPMILMYWGDYQDRGRGG